MLIETFNNILITGKALLNWLESEMILLPKPKNWESDFLLTRLIILLECSRKLFLKIITNRLYLQLSKFPILSPYNFADLSGGNTTSPILTLTNLIKYVKDNRKHLWLLFQDISKVFNSIDPYF